MDGFDVFDIVGSKTETVYHYSDFEDQRYKGFKPSVNSFSRVSTFDGSITVYPHPRWTSSVSLSK